jgi:hypothetical protein
MAWVLGASIPLGGYGALISDVRVSWNNGRVSHDVLQKIYMVAPMMIAGFAGSVEIGFRLMEDMGEFLAAPKGFVWKPRAAAWLWHRRGRRIFTLSTLPSQRLGSAVIIVGCSNRKNGPWMWPHCIRMCAPSYELEIIPSNTWASIGSGSRHRNAEKYAKRFADTFMESNTFQTEVHSPGGIAATVARHVRMDLDREPLMSVSNTLQVGTAFYHELKIQNHKYERYDGGWSSNALVDTALASW